MPACGMPGPCGLNRSASERARSTPTVSRGCAGGSRSPTLSTPCSMSPGCRRPKERPASWPGKRGSTRSAGMDLAPSKRDGWPFCKRSGCSTLPALRPGFRSSRGAVPRPNDLRPTPSRCAPRGPSWLAWTARSGETPGTGPSCGSSSGGESLSWTLPPWTCRASILRPAVFPSEEIRARGRPSRDRRRPARLG